MCWKSENRGYVTSCRENKKVLHLVKKASDHDKCVPGSLARNLARLLYQKISLSLNSELPHHLVWFIISFLPTSIPAISLHRIDYLTSLHYWLIMDSHEQMEDFISLASLKMKTNPYISAGVCSHLPCNRVKRALYFWALLKLFIARWQVWLNRYNSTCRLSCKSCMLNPSDFSDTRSWGCGT